MSTPEKKQMTNAHYEQKYAQLASDHCYAEREKLRSHCKQVDRGLRQEFQVVQEGIINQCPAESQDRVDAVLQQGRQAIGAVWQQAEEYVKEAVVELSSSRLSSFSKKKLEKPSSRLSSSTR